LENTSLKIVFVKLFVDLSFFEVVLSIWKCFNSICEWL